MKNNNKDEVLKGFVELHPLTTDEFLTLRETLTRVGYVKKDEPGVLYQVAHLYHDNGRYYLAHFKQLFLLEGKTEKTVITDADLGSLHSVAYLVNRWGLARLKDEDSIDRRGRRVTVVTYHQKHNWRLVANYTLVKRKRYGTGESDE